MKKKLNPEWVKLGPKADLVFDSNMKARIAKRIMKRIAKEWADKVNKIRHDFLLKKAKEIVNKPTT